MSTPLIQIRGLSVEFENDGEWLEVTHGVDLDIAERQTVALVGESGSGKSVTAMSVLNLLPESARRSGSIRFLGGELIGASESRMRRLRGGDIATIFQEPMTAMNPVYTIAQQLRTAIRSHRTISKAEADARAFELLKRVEMPDPAAILRRYPHQLSGGQRQRAMIAMAISAEPKLLIADEPTTALDVTVQAEILDLLLELQRSLGMSLLLITHDMGVVADVAERVVVMRDGSVVEEADTGSLFARPAADYTRELLASVPGLRADDVRTSSVTVVPGGSAGSDEAGRRPVLALSDVRVEYPAGFRKPPLVAVDGVSLSVAAGEVVGLVGESGSGKSTIGRIALGLAAVAAGEVTVVGHRLDGASARSLREIRRTVSVVFQDPASCLNPRVPIGRSITDPLRWTGLERNGRALAERARELLEQVRIPAAWADRYPHELSGGQRQRVGIARAIATRPAFMVADEPTSALDVSVQAAVLDLLLGLQESMGFSCLFISHDLAVVERVANRVVVLRAGRIVEEGGSRQILRDPVDEYTRQLIAAVPVPDPIEQRRRRELRRELRSRA